MRIILTLVLLLLALHGEVIDKIAIVVNDIPITTYDIKKMTQKTGDKNIAIETLINDALIKSAIKEKGIYVDEFDVEKKMEEIAKHNGMSLFDFKTLLMKKGDYADIKKKIKRELEIEKLMSFYNKRVTKEEIEDYYNSHKNEFIVPKKIEATIYTSSNPKILKKIENNPLFFSKEVKIENRVFEYKHTNPQLLQFLNSVEVNSFSKIVTTGKNEFSIFYIKKREGEVTLPFKMVAPIIYVKLSEKSRRQNFDELLSKLKAKAEIKFLTQQ